MIRKILTAAVVVIVIVAVIVFWDLNRGPLTVDLAFVQIDTQVPTAFIVTFVAGWLFGLFCSTIYLLKVVNDRRRVRKALRVAEAEVSSLRTLPLSEAGD